MISCNLEKVIRKRSINLLQTAHEYKSLFINGAISESFLCQKQKEIHSKFSDMRRVAYRIYNGYYDFQAFNRGLCDFLADIEDNFSEIAFWFMDYKKEHK